MGHAAPKTDDYDRIEDTGRRPKSLLRIAQCHVLKEFLRADTRPVREQALEMELTEANVAGDIPQLRLVGTVIGQKPDGVLDASFDVGLSGPGRLHDLFIGLNAVSPGEYKTRGQGLVFVYGFHPSPFGECLAVMSDRGLTGLSFVVDGNREAAIADQMNGWENASWLEDVGAGADVVAATFRAFTGNKVDQKPLSLLLRGTPYQVRVWEALMQIPPGCVTTYGEMADRMGCGRQAARAFGGACASNRIGILIPCHRVIRDTGAITGYRWGSAKKLAILTLEAAMAPEIHAAE